MDDDRFLYVIDMLVQRIEVLEASQEGLRERLAEAPSSAPMVEVPVHIAPRRKQARRKTTAKRTTRKRTTRRKRA